MVALSDKPSTGQSTQSRKSKNRGIGPPELHLLYTLGASLFYAIKQVSDQRLDYTDIHTVAYEAVFRFG